MLTLLIFLKDDLWTYLLKIFRKLVKIYLEINLSLDIFLFKSVKTKRKKIEMVLKSRRMAIDFMFFKKVEIIIVLTFF